MWTSFSDSLLEIIIEQKHVKRKVPRALLTLQQLLKEYGRALEIPIISHNRYLELANLAGIQDVHGVYSELLHCIGTRPSSQGATR